MSHELVKARLNLFAVLQNLEDLVRYDDSAGELVKDWDVSIQFCILGGPAATVVFKGGECRHVCGKEDAQIKLLFRSAKHLNAMFEGKAAPIPLKGFGRLGFLKTDFQKLTELLAGYLQGPESDGRDEAYVKMATRLKLATAAYAARELAEYDADGRIIAKNIPDGHLELEILPDGPVVSVVFKEGRAEVRKGRFGEPTARMAFENYDAAERVLSGEADNFQEVVQGHVILRGRLPLIDGFSLLLDRIPQYV